MKRSLRRQVDISISREGSIFNFVSTVLNDVGEPEGNEIIQISGLFAQSNFSFKDLIYAVSGNITPSSKNYILCLDPKAVKKGDTLNFNAKNYKVAVVDNLKEENLVYFIYLEEIHED